MTHMKIQFTQEDYGQLRTLAETIFNGKSSRYVSKTISNALQYYNEDFAKKREITKTGNVFLNSIRLPHGTRLRVFSDIAKIFEKQPGYPELSQKNIIQCVNVALPATHSKTIGPYCDLVLTLIDYRHSLNLYDVLNFSKTMNEINQEADRSVKESIWRDNLGYKFKLLVKTPNKKIENPIIFHAVLPDDIAVVFKKNLLLKYQGHFMSFQSFEIAEAIKQYAKTISVRPTAISKITPLKLQRLGKLASIVEEKGAHIITINDLRNILLSSIKNGPVKDNRTIDSYFSLIRPHIQEVGPGIVDVSEFLEKFQQGKL